GCCRRPSRRRTRRPGPAAGPGSRRPPSGAGIRIPAACEELVVWRRSWLSGSEPAGDIFRHRTRAALEFIGTRMGKMKAAVYDRYGPPEVLRIEEVERPVPAEDQVLVRGGVSTGNR